MTKSNEPKIFEFDDSSYAVDWKALANEIRRQEIAYLEEKLEKSIVTNMKVMLIEDAANVMKVCDILEHVTWANARKVIDNMDGEVADRIYETIKEIVGEEFFEIVK